MAVIRNNQKTLFFVGCACVGAYVAYRYWRKRELKSIDEGFEEVTKLDDNNERRVLLLGLDGSGKTSLMSQVAVIDGSGNPYKIPPQPTNGFSVYRLKHGSYIYNVWEIGGGDETRKYWNTFLQDTDLLVFTVDASDTHKLPCAVFTLKQLLGDSRMDAVPILVLANKQDSPTALTPSKVKDALDLQSIPTSKHKVEILGCQTRPLPTETQGSTELTWYHPTMEAVKAKIVSMALHS